MDAPDDLTCIVWTASARRLLAQLHLHRRDLVASQNDGGGLETSAFVALEAEVVEALLGTLVLEKGDVLEVAIGHGVGAS